MWRTIHAPFPSYPHVRTLFSPKNSRTQTRLTLQHAHLTLSTTFSKKILHNKTVKPLTYIHAIPLSNSEYKAIQAPRSVSPVTQNTKMHATHSTTSLTQIRMYNRPTIYAPLLFPKVGIVTQEEKSGGGGGLSLSFYPTFRAGGYREKDAGPCPPCPLPAFPPTPSLVYTAVPPPAPSPL